MINSGNVVSLAAGTAALRVPDAGDRSAARGQQSEPIERIAALRKSPKKARKSAATLRELVESVSQTKRGAEIARAFARWLSLEAPGGYTVNGLREHFVGFADEAGLLDYTGTGNEMICTLCGDAWIGSVPPGWQEISRQLGKLPGVSRVLMSHVQAKELGVKRGQWTVIAPALTSRKQAA